MIHTSRSPLFSRVCDIPGDEQCTLGNFSSSVLLFSCRAVVRFGTMSRIDTLQDDRGLLTCFQGAMVKDEWQQAYQTAHSVSTLDDFIYMINGDSWESSLTSFVEAVPSLKGNRIAVARFKSSFEAGRLALRQAATPATKSEDVDEVLPDGTAAVERRMDQAVPLGL